MAGIKPDEDLDLFMKVSVICLNGFSLTIYILLLNKFIAIHT